MCKKGCAEFTIGYRKIQLKKQTGSKSYSSSFWSLKVKKGLRKIPI
jgi:hypothetical protein